MSCRKFLVLYAILQSTLTTSIASTSASSSNVAKTPSGARKPSATSDFTFSNLTDLVDKNSVQSIDGLLPLLPQDIRSRYVAVYRSRSLQASTFQKPRIIMFDHDAKFIAAFNGDPGLKGYDELEVIQFDESKSAFEFREIHFSKGAKPIVSDANPAKCLACHQSVQRKDVDPRPNWEPYSTWPGVYGSNDGGLSGPGGALDVGNAAKVIDGTLPIDNPEIVDILKLAPGELANAKTFADNYLSDPRYGSLGSPNFKFDSYSSSAEMTLYLTNAIAKQNFKRVARLLTAMPSYPLFKYLLLNELGCFDADRINLMNLPYKLKSQLPQRLQKDPSGADVYIADLLNLFVIPQGVDTSDWSTDFETHGALGFEDRFTTPGGPNEELMAQLALQDKDVAALVGITSNGYVGDIANYRAIEVIAMMKNGASCAKAKTDAMFTYKAFLSKLNLN
jgi:hypothetical protein